MKKCILLVALLLGACGSGNVTDSAVVTPVVNEAAPAALAAVPARLALVKIRVDPTKIDAERDGSWGLGFELHGFGAPADLLDTATTYDSTALWGYAFHPYGTKVVFFSWGPELYFERIIPGTQFDQIAIQALEMVPEEAFTVEVELKP